MVIPDRGSTSDPLCLNLRRRCHRPQKDPQPFLKKQR